MNKNQYDLLKGFPKLDYPPMDFRDKYLNESEYVKHVRSYDSLGFINKSYSFIVDWQLPKEEKNTLADHKM